MATLGSAQLPVEAPTSAFSTASVTKPAPRHSAPVRLLADEARQDLIVGNSEVTLGRAWMSYRIPRLDPVLCPRRAVPGSNRLGT